MSSLINGRNALQSGIKERVVEPHVRGQLHPDVGTARLSHGYFRAQIGATNVAHLNFFESLLKSVEQGVSDFIANVFNQAIKADEIFVDVTVRTPQGNKIIPNLMLNTNGIQDAHDGGVLDALKAGKPLQVKITYDGGRPSECTPVSWRVDHATAEQIAAKDTGYGGSGQFNVDPNTFTGWGNIGQPTGVLANSQLPYAQEIDAAAAKYHLDPRLLAAVGIQETDLGRSALFDPITGLSKTAGNDGHGIFQLDSASGASQATLARAAKDPAFAADYAASMLASNITAFKGDIWKGIAAYNAGVGGASQGGGSGYSSSVQKIYDQLCQQYKSSSVASTQPFTGWGKTSGAAQFRFVTDPMHPLYPYMRYLNAAGTQYGLDPNMLAAIIMLDSHGNTRKVDGKGRMGLFQLSQAQWNQGIGKVQGDFPNLPDNPLIAETNILVGAVVLSQLLDTHVNYKDAIIAYRGYPSSGGKPSNAGELYYKKVATEWKALLNHSQTLTGSKLASRPENTHQDQSSTSLKSGYRVGT